MDINQVKNWITVLGFQPKDGTQSVYRKTYSQHCNYEVEVNFAEKKISYGNKIVCGSKRTQNFSSNENFVVLECVDRLLAKGYKPENIELEKIWSAGHGRSAELDVCVYTEDHSKEYMLIECKTSGSEFAKAFARMKKDGGQLFTYFKFSNNADWILLYASELQGSKFVFKNEIIKIEEEYRHGDVKDFHDRWNKLTKDNGVFDDRVKPYNPTSLALTIDDLCEIEKEDSNFIFNQFLEILRHNVVSDKPNAFNKIFTLFLCKIYDEKEREGTDEELHFQWKDSDDHATFQIRLTDLYKNGMKSFLEKHVSDFSEDEFDKKYKSLEEATRKAIKDEINKLRLEKNNEFAIKEVFDKKSFEENAVVVKEVVELLQKFKLRYNRKHQYLSDFFELLLTTGLKQEAGQFFTPVPIAQFIVRSLPIDAFVKEKMRTGEQNEFLPYVIDYAAGSGHFLTESMHLIQHLLDNKNLGKLKKDVQTKLKTWQDDPFDWAFTYIYGVEKDYRLVKVGKVGCYLHGDGLANVIHSDGLASFDHDDYKQKLGHKVNDFPKENKQFDIVVSNPPYSVAAFKNVARTYYTENDYDLYDTLTDSSSEIECLFVERTKQLLKDGGVAGIILPSSMLSNAGIYQKTREMLLQYFDIIAIADLGSNTFMATGTNTITLFLQRRNNYVSTNLKHAVEKFFTDYLDVTINGVERPMTQYVNYVWNGLSLDDYISILQKKPSEIAESHEMYQNYLRKFAGVANESFWNHLLAVEKEKLLYFILAIPQTVVLIKSGEKDVEKRFLGYEFSNRRGHEGIHPIQRGKLIDECTQLFDPDCLDNPEKASTYIHRAFSKSVEDFSVPENLKKHVFQMNLADMIVFDQADFQKTIQLAVKKKVKSKWSPVPLREVSQTIRGVTYSKEDISESRTSNIILTADNITLEGHFSLSKEIFLQESKEIDEDKRLRQGDCFICFSSGSKSHVGKVAFIEKKDSYLAGGFMGIIRANSKVIIPKLLHVLLNSDMLRDVVRDTSSGSNINNLSNSIGNINIPLPPLDVQARIVKEIEAIERKENETKDRINQVRKEIISKANSLYAGKLTKLELACDPPMYGAAERSIDGNPQKDYRYIRITDIDDFGNLNNDWKTAENIEEKFILQVGDFLFARSGATAGKTFLYRKEMEKAIFAGYLIRFVAKKDLLLPEFLNFILKSEHYTSWVLAKRHGTAQPNINAKQYSNFEIPLPPLSEQQTIVAKIERLESEIAELQKSLETFSEQKNAVLKKFL